MKKYILFIAFIALFILAGHAHSQDMTLSELPELTTATEDDIFYVVDVTGEPIGGKRARKITLENLANSLIALGIGTGDQDYLTEIPVSGEITDEQVACWETSETPGVNKLKSCGAKTTDNSTAMHLLCKNDSGEIENCNLAGLAISGTASPTITVEAVPSNATVNAAGEVTVDTTTDQFRWYGTAQQQLSPILTFGIVIADPAEADDINIMKAPYGMTIMGIDCIVQGTTSVTGQLQECTSAGASCTDLDSDITCDSDGAADDGSLTDNTIASGSWIRWKTTSVSGTPTFLTVTVRYKVVAD